MKILANGEIVADDDPRAKKSVLQPNTSGEVRPRNAADSGIHNLPQQRGDEVVGHGPTANMFDSIDQRLTSYGVPTWHIGPYPVSPIVSCGFLLSLLLMGFRGLLFSGLLFAVVNYSRSNGAVPSLFSFFGTGRPANTQRGPNRAQGVTPRIATLGSEPSTGQPQKRQDGQDKKYFTGPGHRLS